MVQTPLKEITLKDFLDLPETEPASEYVDGRIIQKPMPKADHSGIQTDLAAAINNSIRTDKVGRAFSELRCTFGGSSIVPDITVLPWDSIPRSQDGALSGELLGAPTWMIEILSAKQSQSKVVRKILRAIDQGTEMGWLIDPAEKLVFTYRPNLPTELWEATGDRLPTPAFASNFSLSVAALVGWLYA